MRTEPECYRDIDAAIRSQDMSYRDVREIYKRDPEEIGGAVITVESMTRPAGSPYIEAAKEEYQQVLAALTEYFDCYPFDSDDMEENNGKRYYGPVIVELYNGDSYSCLYRCHRDLLFFTRVNRVGGA